MINFTPTFTNLETNPISNTITHDECNQAIFENIQTLSNEPLWVIGLILLLSLLSFKESWKESSRLTILVIAFIYLVHVLIRYIRMG